MDEMETMVWAQAAASAYAAEVGGVVRKNRGSGGPLLTRPEAAEKRRVENIAIAAGCAQHADLILTHYRNRRKRD